MEIQVFLCKGQGLHPKNWAGQLGGDTCEQEDDEGVQGEINIPEVRKMGGQRRIPDPGGSGGDWMPPSPCFGGAPVRRGWEEGQLFLTPYSMENTERGFSFEKTLGITPPAPRADFGVIPLRSWWRFFFGI